MKTILNKLFWQEEHLRTNTDLRSIIIIVYGVFSPLLDWRPARHFWLIILLTGGGAGGEVIAQAHRLWATYYGGIQFDEGWSVATDAAGNTYLAGDTYSTSGIATPGGFQNTLGGQQDAFLVKFDASGNRLWATYYGGSGKEYGWNVATDAIGNVYLTGETYSTSGIATSGGFQNSFGGGNSDAFLVKFSTSGIRLWATYYGGTNWDDGESVATDAAGNVYLAGETNSPSGIATSGGFQNSYGGGNRDAFLVKFDGISGNRLWATYYGGTENDHGHGVATDVAGNVYLSATSPSAAGIATLSGFQNAIIGSRDAFLVKFNGAGNRLWATYYGGTGSMDWGCGVATDAAGNVYLVGETNSSSGIATSNGFQNSYGGGNRDAFLVKFDGINGNRLWATYYGGMGDEEICWVGGVAIDGSDNVYLAGRTSSTNGIAAGGFQSIKVGNMNLFVVKFNSNGSRLCATYYGQNDYAYDNVAVDKLGNVYLSGSTTSAVGIAAGGFQNIYGGAGDAYLVKFGISAVATSTTIACFGQCSGNATAVGLGSCTPPYTYSWSTLPVQTTQVATGLCAGIYTVTITDASGVANTATVTIQQQLSALSSSVISNKASCKGQCNGNATVSLSGGTPGYTYSWNTAPVQINSNATGLCPGTYSCAISDSIGCTTTQLVTITESSAITLNASTTNNTNCITSNGSATANASGGTPAYVYSWNTAPMQVTPTAAGLATGNYTATVTDSNGCTQTQTVSISAPVLPMASVSSDNVSCRGGIDGSATVIATGGVSPYNYSWSPTGGSGPAAAGLSAGVYTVIVTDVNGCTNAQAVTIGPGVTSEIYFPNAFSPNNDGENDEFSLQGESNYCIKELKIIIYDRLGEKVYETNDIAFKWDGFDSRGILRGNEGSAVFVYSVNALFMDGTTLYKRGNISLIR